MNQAIRASMLWIVLVGGWAGAADGPGEPLASMVQAERDFSRTSVERGVREAFLTFMAEDGLVFRPRPVKAHDWYRDRPPAPGTLVWQPAYVEISRSGTMGFSTGPFEYRPEQQGADSVWGHFVSVWAVQDDGSWKVVADLGNSHARPEDEVELQFREPSAATTKPGEAADPAALLAQLLEADRKFSDRSREDGSVSAYLAVAADDVRIYRAGRLPSLGKKASRRLLRDIASTESWVPAGGQVSTAGDLGFTYGEARREADPPGASSYLRIWRRNEAAWQLVIDVDSPIPTE